MLAATFATSAASGVATQWPVSRRGVLFAACRRASRAAAQLCRRRLPSGLPVELLPRGAEERPLLSRLVRRILRPARPERRSLWKHLERRRRGAAALRCLAPSSALLASHRALSKEPKRGVHDASTLGRRRIVPFPPAQVGWASAYDPKRFLPGQSPQGVVYGEDRPARGQMLHTHLPSSRPVARAVVTLQRRVACGVHSSSLRARLPMHGVAAQSPSLQCN